MKENENTLMMNYQGNASASSYWLIHHPYIRDTHQQHKHPTTTTTTTTTITQKGEKKKPTTGERKKEEMKER